MQSYWLNETDPTREEAMLDRLALEVTKRGLHVPAVIFLEMHKPLANVAGHMMLAASPFVSPFIGFDRFDGYSRLLSRPENVERLIQRIENDASLNQAEPEIPQD